MVPSEGELKERFQFISVSNFNKIAKDVNQNPLTLAADEAFVIEGNTTQDAKIINNYFKNRKDKFTFGDKVQEVTIKGAAIRPLTNLGESVLVVSDQIYNSAKQVGKTRIIKNINIEDEQNSSVLTEKLKKVMPNKSIEDESSNSEIPFFDSFYMQYHDDLMISGIFIFIGFFLGL
ncbi:ABC transporter permease, partial [Bacillus cereus]